MGYNFKILLNYFQNTILMFMSEFDDSPQPIAERLVETDNPSITSAIIREGDILAQRIDDRDTRERAYVHLIKTYATLAQNATMLPHSSSSEYELAALKVLDKIPTTGLSRLHHIEGLSWFGKITDNNYSGDKAQELADDEDWAKKTAKDEKNAAKARGLPTRRGQAQVQYRSANLHEEANEVITTVARLAPLNPEDQPKDPDQEAINDLLQAAQKLGGEHAAGLAKDKAISATDKERLATVKGIAAVALADQRGSIPKSSFSLREKKETVTPNNPTKF